MDKLGNRGASHTGDYIPPSGLSDTAGIYTSLSLDRVYGFITSD